MSVADNLTTNLFRPAPGTGMLHTRSKGVAVYKLICWVAVAVAGLGGAAVQAGPVLHVDDDAPLLGDGLSWNTAYRFLQDALANALPGTEIRVAQGTYKPDEDETGNVTPGDREASFSLLSGVALRGGYLGLSAGKRENPDDRNIAVYETVLSGDLAGDDGPDFANNEENAWHAIRVTGADGTTAVEGFTVTGGNADGPVHFVDKVGAGMFLKDAGIVVVAECRFVENKAAKTSGSAIYCEGSSLTIRNCLFLANPHLALEVRDSDALVVDSVFDGDGQTLHLAILNFRSASIVIGCEFRNNMGPRFLVGAVINQNGTFVAVNCLFRENLAAVGGGFSNTWFGDGETGIAALANCTFTSNVAIGNHGGGGAIYNGPAGFSEGPGAFIALNNCILWNNDASFEDDGSEEAQINNNAGEVALSYSCVEGLTGAFGGPGNIGDNPLFVDPANGDFRLQPGSPSIDAGNNWAVAPDTADLDSDADTAELTPLDLDGNARFIHAPVTPHPGCGTPAVVDMGAYEFPAGRAADIKLADIDGDGTVGMFDLVTLIISWGPAGGGCQLADFDVDGIVGVPDLLILLANWG